MKRHHPMDPGYPPGRHHKGQKTYHYPPHPPHHPSQPPPPQGGYQHPGYGYPPGGFHPYGDSYGASDGGGYRSSAPPPVAMGLPNKQQDVDALLKQIDILHAKLETVAKMGAKSSLDAIIDSSGILRRMAQQLDMLPILNPVALPPHGPRGGGGGAGDLNPSDHKRHRRPSYPPAEPPYGGNGGGFYDGGGGGFYDDGGGRPRPRHGGGGGGGQGPYRGGYGRHPGLDRDPNPSAEAEPGPRYRGTVKSWFIYDDNGFVVCQDPACMGQDVYVMARHLRPGTLRLRNGEEVDFALAWPKGKPQARDCFVVGKPPARRMVGECVKWNEQRKFGFITSDDYTKGNIFCLSTEVLDRRERRRLYVGERVELSLVMSEKGQPQAQDVLPLDGETSLPYPRGGGGGGGRGFAQPRGRPKGEKGRTPQRQGQGETKKQSSQFTPVNGGGGGGNPGALPDEETAPAGRDGAEGSRAGDEDFEDEDDDESGRT